MWRKALPGMTVTLAVLLPVRAGVQASTGATEPVTEHSGDVPPPCRED
jgi:hypothetical protein